MPISEQEKPPLGRSSISQAEAFYVLFRRLPEKDKLAVAKYILEDEDVRRHTISTGIPNETTLNAFAENKADLPLFESIEALREDLLS